MKRLVFEKSRYHRFAFYFDYDQPTVDFCKILKDSFGYQQFSFDTADGVKRWVFSAAPLVGALKTRFPEMIVDEEVERLASQDMAYLAEFKEREVKVESVKQKDTTEFSVRNIKGDMYPYQKVGVEFLLASGGRAIIADAPGVGKSLQALGFIAHIEAKRSLIVCPATVKPAWEKEVKKWTKLSSVVIDPKTKIEEIPHDTQVWIINYDVLKKHMNTLMKVHFDVMVNDECHLVKNHQAQRTKVVRALSKNIKNTVFLSGTPLLSRPIEMFTLLNMIDPYTWNNWYDYARKYCGGTNTPYGFEAKGSTNTEELHSRISRYFIRRTKDQVLSFLPPKNRIQIPVELDKETRKEYDTAEENLVAYLKEYSGKQPAEIAKTLQAQKLAQLNALRFICASGKIKAAEDIIDSVIESGEKILVFSSFVEPLDKLQEKYGAAAVMITGKTAQEERGPIVEAFQTNPGVQLFLGGIKSAGVGITLTAGTNVLFLDYSWNPADHQQAEDRIHRPGQEASSVNIYSLYAEHTIDDKLVKMLAAKQKIFDRVIDGKFPEKCDDAAFIKDVLSEFSSKANKKKHESIKV